MFEAKISVEHHLCSLATVTRDKGLELEILSHIPIDNNRILFLVQEVKRDTATPSYLKDIESHESTKAFEVIQLSSEKTLFMATVNDPGAIHVFENSHCFIKHPIIVKNGNKYYTVLATHLTHLNRAYDKLKYLGRWSIDAVRDMDDDVNKEVLTTMQQKILLVANRMGYFEDPRRVSIEEVGRAIGISKSTTHNHLRKATQKLVEEYLSQIN